MPIYKLSENARISPRSKGNGAMLEMAETVPALSVVIPTRDRGDVIQRAVESVLIDTRPELEVIVVDDGSADHTAARLSKIRDPRVRFYRVESSGNANRARNFGARHSRSAIISFLDSDDTFGPDRVDRLVRFFARRPDVDCLVDGFVELSRGETRAHLLPEPVSDRSEMRRLLMAHLIPLTNSAITVRRAAFEAVEGYDERMPRHQDRELLLRLALDHSIWFGDSNDVTKHRLKKSLSHEHRGYIVGMDALAARCLDYWLPENSEIFRYLIVRGLVKALANGRWLVAAREFREWRKAEHLPKDYLKCFRAYRIGRCQRLRSRRGR